MITEALERNAAPARLAEVPGAQRLLASAGLEDDVALVPLAGGANNRVFRVEAPAGRALLKVYFRDPGDPRDRLAAEFAFASFAWAQAVQAIPRPIACDHANGLGLYEFIEGERLEPEEITQARVGEALDFFRALNQARDEPGARALPDASEAVFSLREHVRLVEGRLARLEAIEENSAVERDAARFVRGELRQAWERCGRLIERQASDGMLDAPVAAADRRLSPSDFGFHNAIRGRDGRMRFIDFEYAGWDDPVRTICDFFCQPAVPVPQRYLVDFAAGVLEGTIDAARHLRRLEAMLPLYRLKWCCIVLNCFLPLGGRRRRFACGPVGEEQKVLQLARARQIVERLGCREREAA